MKEKVKRKEQESGIIRVSAQSKERLEQMRHPGQSYDGFLEEVLDHWEETHPKEVRKPPVQKLAPPPSGGKEPARESWWWWPEKNSVGTDNEEVNNNPKKRR